MKMSPLVMLCIVLFSTALGQTKTVNDAKRLESQIFAVTAEGHVKTNPAGYYMRAKVNGNTWVATHMVPDNDQSSILLVQGFIGGSAVANAIVFKVSWKSENAGKKRSIDKNSDIYYYDNDVKGYQAVSGERETTKIDDEWIEGKFQFSAVEAGSGKTIDITEGFYRVPNPKRLSK